jgi:hypothetical protein
MLTFIIPAFGQSPYLEACIISLKNQETPCKIIITTSTPNYFISSLVSKYDLDIFINPSRTTIAGDWNFSLKCARSSLVALAHQDDTYHPSFSTMALKEFSLHSECAIYFTDSLEIINGKSYSYTKRELIKRILRKIAFFQAAYISKGSQFFRLLAFGCPIPCSSVVFNIAKLNGLKFSEDFTVNLDWDLWSRIALQKKMIGYIRGSYVAHRIHKDAETQLAIKDFRRQEEDKKIFLRFWPELMASTLLLVYKLGY